MTKIKVENRTLRCCCSLSLCYILCAFFYVVEDDKFLLRLDCFWFSTQLLRLFSWGRRYSFGSADIHQTFQCDEGVGTLAGG